THRHDAIDVRAVETDGPARSRAGEVDISADPAVHQRQLTIPIQVGQIEAADDVQTGQPEATLMYRSTLPAQDLADNRPTNRLLRIGLVGQSGAIGSTPALRIVRQPQFRP